MSVSNFLFFCFFIDTAPPEIYTYGHTLSLHDALPISAGNAGRVVEAEAIVERDVDPRGVEAREIGLALDQLDDLAVDRVAGDIGAKGIVRLRHVGVIALELDVAVGVGVDSVADLDAVIIDRETEPARATRREERAEGPQIGRAHDCTPVT